LVLIRKNGICIYPWPVCSLSDHHRIRDTSRGVRSAGHEIVGAIADERLAGTPTAAKIAVLLDGMSLEKASVIADQIKGWDKNGVNDSSRSITWRAETLTPNCALSGRQINQRTT